MTQADSMTTVSERALIARINRALARESYERVRRCTPGSKDYAELGRYFAVDLNLNTIAGKWIDLETRGRELGVLGDHECLERA